jgi:hypothetical protein
MDVLCLDGYSEALPGDGEHTELVIEDLVALILLDLFDAVVVDGVEVTCLPKTQNRQSLCSLQVRAVCPTEAASTPAESLETLEARLENALCCSLIELFSTVLINTVSVRYERNAAPDTATQRIKMGAVSGLPAWPVIR